MESKKKSRRDVYTHMHTHTHTHTHTHAHAHLLRVAVTSSPQGSL